MHSNKNWGKPSVMNLWNLVCPAYDVYENTKDQLFKQSLAGVKQNFILSHFQFAQRFYLKTIFHEQFE